MGSDLDIINIFVFVFILLGIFGVVSFAHSHYTAYQNSPVYNQAYQEGYHDEMYDIQGNNVSADRLNASIELLNIDNVHRQSSIASHVAGYVMHYGVRCSSNPDDIRAAGYVDGFFAAYNDNKRNTALNASKSNNASVGE